MLNKWEQEQSSALHLQQSCCALLGSAPVPGCPTQVSLAVSHPLAAVPSWWIASFWQRKTNRKANTHNSMVQCNRPQQLGCAWGWGRAALPCSWWPDVWAPAAGVRSGMGKQKGSFIFYSEKGIHLLPTRCHGWVWVDVGTHSAAKLSRLLGATPYESKPGINFHDLKAKSWVRGTGWKVEAAGRRALHVLGCIKGSVRGVSFCNGESAAAPREPWGL